MSSVNRVSARKVSAFLALGILFSVAQGCEVGDAAPASDVERSALLVDVDTATAVREYDVRREFIGRLEPTRESQVGFELGGELQAVLVDEGDTVAAGDVLARLDTARLEARLAEVEAAVAQAASARDLAQRSYERRRDAAAAGGISEQVVDEALDAANAAAAGLSAAEARLNSVRVDLAKSELSAPYDAVVVARRIDEGNIVAAGQPVVHVQERAAPDVRVGVSGDLAATMSVGEAHPIVIGPHKLDATVRAILPLRDPSTRTVDVILVLDRNVSAYPGDLARLAVQQSVMEDGFWLPVTSLSEGSRGLWTANVVVPFATAVPQPNGATHFVEPRSVEVLHKQDHRVFVRGALNDGDRFITNGMQRIVPNQGVRIAGAYASTAGAANRHE